MDFAHPVHPVATPLVTLRFVPHLVIIRHTSVAERADPAGWTVGVARPGDKVARFTLTTVTASLATVAVVTVVTASTAVGAAVAWLALALSRLQQTVRLGTTRNTTSYRAASRYAPHRSRRIYVCARTDPQSAQL